jgi:beta-lactamase regulating signal transducer with metallopeptidase domain
MNTASLFSLATDIVVGSTILMVVAISLGLLLKRLSAATRHFYWATLIVSLLLLPAITFLSPKYSLGFLPGEQTYRKSADEKLSLGATPIKPTGLPLTDAGSSDVELGTTSSVPHTNVSILNSETSMVFGNSARRPLLLTWILGSIGIGFWMLAGWFRLRRLVQQSNESSDPALQMSCQKMALALRLSRPIRIMISDRTMMPLVIGSRKATLILPSNFTQWESTRQQAVLSHEIGHIKRYDCATQLLGHLLCAAYWFHPLSWVISRKLQSEAEAACDDLAIRAGSELSQYAEHLLSIARSFKGLRILSGTAAQMAGHSKLEKRLRLILAKGTDRNQLSRNCILLCSTATLVVALGFSTIRITANNETNAPGTDASPSPGQDVETALVSPVILAKSSQANPRNEADNSVTETTQGIPADDDTPSQSPPLRLAGTTESTNKIHINSNLDKPTAILWHTPCGQGVKKGDLIVEFEQGKLVESIDAKQIELAQGQAELEAAKSSLYEVRRNLEEILETQELSLKLAELKREKGNADFRLKLKTAESNIKLSERRLDEASSNLATTHAKVKAGVTGPEDAQSAETRLEDSKAKLEQAKDLYDNLINYEKAYEQVEHQLTIQQAKSSHAKRSDPVTEQDCLCGSRSASALDGRGHQEERTPTP